MKLLKIFKETNRTLESEHSHIREAARAVLVDNRNCFAIIHVSKDNFYKIPGGGIDKGESIQEALKREVLEEAGCNIEILEPLGKTIEFRTSLNMKQISYGFLARVKGPKKSPKFTKKEQRLGFKLIWTNVVETRKLFENAAKNTTHNGFATQRARCFFEEGLKKLKL